MPFEKKHKKSGEKGKINLKLPYIQIRVNPEDKEKWFNYAKVHKFNYISNLVRYAVNGLIEGDLITKSISNNNLDAKIVKILEEKLEMHKKELEEIRNDMKKEKRIEEIQSEVSDRAKIFKLLKVAPLDPEEIARFYYDDNWKEREGYITLLCENLCDRGSLKLNEDLKYEVIRENDVE